jgi:hypothetical protein
LLIQHFLKGEGTVGEFREIFSALATILKISSTAQFPSDMLFKRLDEKIKN